MAKNRKTQKPPKSRKSIVKTAKLVKSNREVINKIQEELKKNG
jgi:hypothetical protein